MSFLKIPKYESDGGSTSQRKNDEENEKKYQNGLVFCCVEGFLTNACFRGDGVCVFSLPHVVFVLP